MVFFRNTVDQHSLSCCVHFETDMPLCLYPIVKSDKSDYLARLGLELGLWLEQFTAYKITTLRRYRNVCIILIIINGYIRIQD